MPVIAVCDAARCENLDVPPHTETSPERARSPRVLDQLVSLDQKGVVCFHHLGHRIGRIPLRGRVDGPSIRPGGGTPAALQRVDKDEELPACRLLSIYECHHVRPERGRTGGVGHRRREHLEQQVEERLGRLYPERRGSWRYRIEDRPGFEDDLEGPEEALVDNR